MKESNHLENLGVDRLVPRILKKQEEGVWTGSISFGKGKYGGLLYKRGWTFGFHQMWWIC